MSPKTLPVCVSGVFFWTITSNGMTAIVKEKPIRKKMHGKTIFIIPVGQPVPMLTAIYFRYPNGDEVYNVIGVYLAENVSGRLSMADGESLELKYFPLGQLPANLVERAKIILEKHF